jgi:hypothetical protein
LSRLLQGEEDEESERRRGSRQQQQGGTVRVVESVRASFDRVLTESRRRREEGGQEEEEEGREGVQQRHGHLLEEGVVCRLASRCSVPGEGQEDGGGHVRTDTTEGRRKVIAWLRGLGVRVGSKGWLPRCETGLDQSRRSLEGRASGARWADELCNGVMLCELAAVLEARSDAAKARADLRFMDGRFLLKGTEVKPRCYAQVRIEGWAALMAWRRAAWP